MNDMFAMNFKNNKRKRRVPPAPAGFPAPAGLTNPADVSDLPIRNERGMLFGHGSLIFMLT